MKIDNRHIANMVRGAIVVAIVACFFVRCATTLTPTGGPKDTLPPVIVAMTPDNYTTNFDAKSIYIEFDEFVKISNQHKEFFTSPAMKSKPTLYTRGRGIVVTIKDTLLENTTYSLNFGSAISDNNEGNPLNAMRFVFSTGESIDSMIISGYTADSFKADSVSKSYIYLFAADSIEHVAEYDSTLFKYSPVAIARAEKNGIFIAQNLKPIRYRAYAIEDTNDNQLYEPGTDQVGFISDEFAPQELPGFAIWYDSIRQYPTADPQLYFRMFTDVAFKRQLLQEYQRPIQNKAVLYFGAPNPQVEDVVIEGLEREDIIMEPSAQGDTLTLWFNAPSEQLRDTLRTVVSYFKHDSLNNFVLSQDSIRLTWRFVESKEAEKKRLEKESERDAAIAAGEEWKDADQVLKIKMPTGDINPEKSLIFDFEYPLLTVDTLQMLITCEDSKGEITDKRVEFRRDSSKLRRYHLRSDWGEWSDSKYTITMPAGSITDIRGYSNDSVSSSYSTLNPSQFASVVLNISDSREVGDRGYYTLQLLDGNSKLIEQKQLVGRGQTTFNFVPAGEVQLRVIDDKNGNGVWDTGNLVERREPERSEMLVQDEVSVFTTKVNWEIELDVDMGNLFSPVSMQSLIELLDQRESQRLVQEHKKKLEAEAKAQQQQGSSSSSSSGMFNIGGITQSF